MQDRTRVQGPQAPRARCPELHRSAAGWTVAESSQPPSCISRSSTVIGGVTVSTAALTHGAKLTLVDIARGPKLTLVGIAGPRPTLVDTAREAPLHVRDPSLGRCEGTPGNVRHLLQLSPLQIA